MPAEYVNKLARMFQDIKVSEDLNREFKERNTAGHVTDMCLSCDSYSIIIIIIIRSR